ncbi:MAG: alpha-2-macroglobulin family protein [Hyphomicrobiales bacterium]|uniref:alpha-2-macroglobulin family protein n=1 Tax=Nisaea sp. TaxID=2024842 RepID=UPI0032707FD9
MRFLVSLMDQFFPKLVLALVTAGIASFDAPPLAAQETQKVIQTVPNADYFGFDYRTVKDVALDQCSAECLADSQCKAFTYNQSAGWCFLKDGFGTLQSADGAVAGRVVVKTARAADSFNDISDLTFVDKGVVRDVDALRAAFAAQTAKSGANELAARYSAASAENDFPNMRSMASAWVTADGLSFDAWRAFANTYWRSRSNKWQEKRDYQSKAISGALEMYRLAEGNRQISEALNALARALALSDRYRPALEAYKKSLATFESPRVRADYEALDADHGFRMLDYSVDSDAVNPRVCLQFSERLDTDNVEYTDYLRLNGAEPSDVRASNKEVCVGGLVHGERYRLDMRAGLPAEIGEKIDNLVTLDVYVRDRSPNVRFTGSSYVLSRSHARGIPVVTVNVDSVDVSVFRVTDAAISELLRSNSFNKPLTSGALERLTENLATPIWSGALEVDGALNKDTTTLMPVFRVIGDLQPGAYALLAEGPQTNDSFWQPKATQWFVVSDLGLSSLSADDGLHVYARSLETTAPLADVPLKLVARNNDILGRAMTDANGYASFAPGLLRGERALRAAAVIAETSAPDYAILDLEAAGFDLSDRGVDGRTSPGAVDAFLYTERGVYRPGATVYSTAILRDSAAEALEGLPLTFIMMRPDGVEFARKVSVSDETGGHAQNFVLPGNALRGSWEVQIFTDPNSLAVATKRFLVEDFLPERIDFDFSVQDEVIEAGSTVTVGLNARYLFGAPATGLAVEGSIFISPEQPSDGPYKGFVFGLSDEKFTPVSDNFSPSFRTDAAGKGSFELSIPGIPATTLPLSAQISVTMADGGGRPVERTLDVPLASTGPSLGIRPLFDFSAPEGETAEFQLVSLDADGKQVAAKNASYELLRIERSYQWYRKSNGRWGWEPITRTDRISAGKIDLLEDQLARLDVPVEWGAYRLEVIAGEAVASYDFYAGWYVEKSAFDTPDALQVGLDKDAYVAGETAQVRINADRAGKLQLLVANENLLAVHNFDVAVGEHSLDLPVEDDWGAGAYVLATLHHPMDVENGQLPTRSIGVDWLAMNPASRTLSVAMELPSQILPKTTMTVPIKVVGLAGGEAHIVVSAVDQGILNLTRYTPPMPEKWYFGQRRLGAVLRDLYGQLIDGLSGTEGRLRVGGDAATAGLSMDGNPPAEAPVSLYSGIVSLDENGEASISFDVPQFNGTLKLMAVAWSESKLGGASADVIVRDPVVMTATMPRFLAPGDTSRLLIQFDNTDGDAGDYALEVVSTEHVTLGEKARGTISLEKKGSKNQLVRLEGVVVGDASLDIVLVSPNGRAMSKSLTLPVRANTQPVSNSERIVLSPDGTDSASHKISDFVLKQYVPGTASLSVALGAGAGLNPAALYSRLDRYAYRCSEQTTSRAMPLLSKGTMSAGDRKTIEASITRLVTHQNSAGSFGLWGASFDRDLWLDAYVSDFLTRAKEAGFDVPEVAFEQAINNIKNTMSFSTNIDSDGNAMAYALYVLARNGEATLGDLRYFVDAKFASFSSPIAKAQLGASLALYGEKVRAKKAFESAKEVYFDRRGFKVFRVGPRDYGTNVRDGAAIMSLVAESGVEQIEMSELAEAVIEDRRNDNYLSTQEMAWLTMASGSLSKANGSLKADVSQAGIQLEQDPDGDGSGVISFGFNGDELANGPVVVRNQMSRSLPLLIETSGVPRTTPLARNNGFAVTREFLTRDGTPVELANVSQNDRLVVLLTIRQLVNRTDKLLLVDPLPAGFEIDNPSLLQGARGGLTWLPKSGSADYSAFLDDRFVVGFNGKSFEEMPVTDGSNVWSFAYQVRAVSPGLFGLPPTHVEDMYSPEIFGTTAAQTVSVFGPLE